MNTDRDRNTPLTIQVAVLTVSDRCSSGAAIDTAGPAVERLLERELEAQIVQRRLVPDEQDTISQALIDLADRDCDLVLTVGGTGFGPRDVTPEATHAVIDRDAPGLAEAMRAASIAITPNAMLQRGVCGIRGRTLIVNLPGSERASQENLEVIVAVLPHAVNLLRGHTRHSDDRCQPF